MFTHARFYHPLPGFRPISENSLWHNAIRPTHAGWDLAAPLGTPIYACAAGKVVESGMSSGLGGFNVKIDHGYGWRTAYFHLPGAPGDPAAPKDDPITPRVAVGQIVRAGEQIAVVGQSGNAAAPHLHLEIRRFGRDLDPGVWLAEVCPAALVKWVQGKVGAIPDGLYGPSTAAKVRGWQAAAMPAMVTGTADPLTIAIMAGGAA